MHSFSHYISCTKAQILYWKSRRKNSLEDDILQIEQDIIILELLDCIPNPKPSKNLSLHALYNSHLALLRQNSLRWAQRTRLIWLKNGDFNSKFFNNFDQIRSHHNKIFTINDNSNWIHYDFKGISVCFIEFHSQL